MQLADKHTPYQVYMYTCKSLRKYTVYKFMGFAVIAASFKMQMVDFLFKRNMF